VKAGGSLSTPTPPDVRLINLHPPPLAMPKCASPAPRSACQP